MNKMEYTELELKGIEATKHYLRKRGMEVLTNEPFECEAGRFEIVAKDRDRDGLVFVRVNTRPRNAGGQPIHEVDEAMRETLESTALAYLEGHEEANTRLLFDAIDITIVSSERAMLRHQFGIM